MPRHPSPDELFDESPESPLLLELACCRCSRKTKHAVPWALVHPDFSTRDREEERWDGILLGRIFECPQCGAEDDYALTPRARMAILGQALACVADADGEGTRRAGVRVGIAQLYDGTTVRRPSMALAHSRALAAERPESGEAWRRLGNTCERWGRATEAEEAWRRAVQVDAKEFEAAHSLAVLHFRADRPQAAFPFLRAAIERLPGARDLDAELRRKFGESLAWWLEEIVAGSGEPIALEAAWPDGAIRRDGVLMRLSSVDLRKVTDWKRLGAFLARSDIQARLTSRMPVDDEYTQLQALLDGVDPSDDDLERPLVVTPPAPHVRASPRVGRNDPCPCRSGKKWKKCCANRPTQEPAAAR
jgi:hypothetical protein